MWKVMRPSGSLRMFVIHTGSPPPSFERLDGMVYGVKASFELLGKGTDVRKLPGPDGPSMPCDSSRIGLLRPVTRQIKRPSPGRLLSKPFLARFSSR